MAEKDLEAADIERKVHDLAQAMSRVRSAQADRDDVVVEMKHAKVSRLELLADDLMPVFDKVPEGSEQFEFAVTNGETPRLWIDMTSFVRMGADGREYEFVKDTRMGRTILGRSLDREIIGIRITDYVAERVLERERMIEGDWMLAKARASDATSDWVGSEEALEDVESAQDGSSGRSVLTWMLVGLAIGLAIILAAIVTDQFDPFLASVREFFNRF